MVHDAFLKSVEAGESELDNWIQAEKDASESTGS